MWWHLFACRVWYLNQKTSRIKLFSDKSLYSKRLFSNFYGKTPAFGKTLGVYFGRKDGKP